MRLKGETRASSREGMGEMRGRFSGSWWTMLAVIVNTETGVRHKAIGEVMTGRQHDKRGCKEKRMH